MIILLVFTTLSVSNIAEAVDFKHVPPHPITIVQAVNLYYENVAAYTILANELESLEAETSNTDFLSSEQMPAPWCYTAYGRFPMQVILPAGVPCTAIFSFYPYSATGITGF